jgi:hypothetical protein
MIGVARRTMMTVRRSGALGADANGGEGGACETVGASSREPIRRDEERMVFERLKPKVRARLRQRRGQWLNDSRGTGCRDPNFVDANFPNVSNYWRTSLNCNGNQLTP